MQALTQSLARPAKSIRKAYPRELTRKRLILAKSCLLLCLTPARAAAAALLVQEVDVRDLRGGKRFEWSNNTYISGDRMRLETVSSGKTAEPIADQIVLPGGSVIYRLNHPEKTFTMREISEGIWLPPFIAEGFRGSGGWNHLSYSEAEIEPYGGQDSQGCRTYRVGMDFRLKNFRSLLVSEGRIEGKAWLCSQSGERGKKARALDRFEKKYKLASGKTLTPRQEAMFAVGDISVMWEIYRADVEQLAKDICSGLDLIPGRIEASRFTWHLPERPAGGLKPVKMEFAGGRNRQPRDLPKLSAYRRVAIFFHDVGEKIGFIDSRPPQQAFPAIEIATKLKIADGDLKISKKLFQVPARYKVPD